MADVVSFAYEINTSTVNTISLVYMGVFLIVNFPSNFIIDKYGCRTAVRIFGIISLLGINWYCCNLYRNVD